MPRRLLKGLATLALVVLAACSGGGGGDGGSTPPPSGGGGNGGGGGDTPPPTATGAFLTEQSTSRMLTMATFGPTDAQVAALTGTNESAWILAEFDKPTASFLAEAQAYYELGTRPEGEIVDMFDLAATTWVFWRRAAEADDQLRQRMVFALSQLLVVSNSGGGILELFPQTIGYYLDILQEHAFGNYRDLLEDVTYSPAMADYLTYLGNQKGDPTTGRVPDENYAREILQLFTIGLVELNTDGSPVLGNDGEPIETFDNDDITGLAKVFTGLFDEAFFFAGGFEESIPQTVVAVAQPLSMFDFSHSQEEKSFLGTTIPAGTSGTASIDLALDHIMAHPNVGPFIGKQLIQRFVTSNPEPDYIERVATAFNTGTYLLPNGTSVGEGRKGDLKATIAAVLFDPDAESSVALNADQFGKVREPVLRVTHFLRAFEADMSFPEYAGPLFNTSPIDILGQHPFRSPSVFNFYRPGYVAPATLSGDLGLTAPELQIVNASSTAGYINYLSYGTFKIQEDEFWSGRWAFDLSSVPFNEAQARRTFVPDYTDELALAATPAALIDHLNEKLLYGSMSDSTRSGLIETLEELSPETYADPDIAEDFVGFAVLMVMSTPDYLVQR